MHVERVKMPPYTNSGMFDIRQEENVFWTDSKLQAVLSRIVANEQTDADWKTPSRATFQDYTRTEASSRIPDNAEKYKSQFCTRISRGKQDMNEVISGDS